MNYFIRISSQNRPANRLQQSILDHFEKYQHVITSDPTSIYNRLFGAVEQASKSHRRCTRQSVTKTEDYKTKQISGIYVSGLVQLSVHPILREVDLYPTHPALDPPTEPATTANKPATSDATTSKTTDEAPENLPRALIYKSREGAEELRFDYWYRFSTQVQELLSSGTVWRIYLNSDLSPIAELYGGRTIPAYL